MDKESIIRIISERLKLIRAEYNFTQEKMADVLGISKKTLVQIEKGRKDVSWTVAVAVCAIFRESDVLRMSLGDEPVELIEIISLGKLLTPKEKTLGGKVWWKDVKSLGRFKVQQNIISGHYRILDEQSRRWCSSFNRKYIENNLEILEKEYKQSSGNY